MTQPSPQPEPVKASPLVALAFLGALGFLWGSSINIAKFLSQEGVPPVAYVFWQALGAAIVMGAIVRLRGERLVMTVQHLRFYAVTGLFGIAIPNMNALFVLGHLSAGVTVLIISVSPLMVYGFTMALRTERFDGLRALGMLLGFGGVLVVLLPRSSLPSPDLIPWAAMALITPLGYAIANTYAALDRPTAGNSLTHGLGYLVVATLLMGPTMVVTDQVWLPLFPPKPADLGLLLQIAATSIATLVWLELVHRAGSVYMSQAGYLV
ncbi:MAG: DMT family transporter, partial [Alphaproteobacteria bacterium]